MTPDPPLGSVLSDLEVLERYGNATAEAVRQAIERVGDAWIDWWNEPLTANEAHQWGGYSVSQLKRRIADGTIPATTDRRIRRRHVPIVPGHEPPIGLEPARPDVVTIADHIAKRRTAR